MSNNACRSDGGPLFEEATLLQEEKAPPRITTHLGKTPTTYRDEADLVATVDEGSEDL